MSVFKIITLGCKVNQCESAYLYERLLRDGWHKAEKNGSADLVIINTCIVTQKASHQSRQEIRRAIRENPGAKLVVTGCYAQVYPEELSKIEGIDIIAGNKAKEKIPELIKDLPLSSSRMVCVQRFHEKEPFDVLPASQFLGRSRAFLKIQDGCESFCSYCIIPYARGPYRSMGIKDVLVSMEHLMNKGYREVVLTGIHLGKYGIDIDTSLNALLKEIGKQKYPVRIRISSIEPNEVSEELLELIAQEDWICKHLHIPLQSGDNRILRNMRRRYTREDFYKLIIDIYKRIPFIAIGTDVMVGFPGETLMAHNNTMSLIKGLPVSYLHVFPYSDRPKSAAFYFKGKIPPSAIKERAKEMRELGKTKRMEFLKRCKGKTFTAIVESKKEDGSFKGLTDNYIKIISSCHKARKKEPIKIKIEGIKEDFALGSVVDA